MKMNNLKRFLGLLSIAGATAFLVVACGDDAASGDCAAGETKAVYKGVTACYAQCNAGVCAATFRCDTDSNLCVPASTTTNNSTNNNTTNTNNNTTTTNNTTNNTNNTTNNTNNTTNNTNNTNNGCTPSTVQGACEPLCQTGCAGEQACVAGGDPVMSVCQAAGTGGQGATCNSMMGCQKGFGCLLESATATSGTCREYCRPNGANTCTGGAMCAPLVQDGSLGACVTPEDTCTIVPNSCPANQMCYNTQVGLRCAAFKADGMVGDSCTAPNQCGNNQDCITVNGGAATCALLCSAQQPCPNNGTCNPLADENGNMLSYGACGN